MSRIAASRVYEVSPERTANLVHLAHVVHLVSLVPRDLKDILAHLVLLAPRGPWGNVAMDIMEKKETREMWVFLGPVEPLEMGC